MRRIKFNVRTKIFSLESDEPDIPDQPDEPTDYLKGIPATVLDLKEPIFKYHPNELTDYITEKSNGDIDKVKGQLPEWEDNYRDVISNLNKESAINRELNDLGSTDYEIVDEKSRYEGSHGVMPLESSNADPKSNGESESVNIGAMNIPKEYQTPKTPVIRHKYDLGDIVSHELGHLNDPHLNENINYGTKFGDIDLRLKYGDRFVDAYNKFKVPGDDFSTQWILGHDKTPFEVYADAASLRSGLFKSGLWDGKEPITEDMVNDYIKSETEFLDSVKEGHSDWYPNNPNINYGSSPQRLAQYYDTDQIVNLLNSSRKFSELDPDGEELEDDITTVETKDFIGIKEPNRPFHRTSYRFGK